MNRRLIIEPEAESDLNEAFKWYERQRSGLGDEFLLGIEAGMAAIRRRPESFRSVRGEIRRASVRRFPYGIFFMLQKRSVYVIAILHAKRNPSIWKRRGRK